MLNISVTGTALSSYYLADPTQFLREQRARTGVANAAGDIRQAARDLRRLTADIDETSTHGATRSRVLQWLTYFGWQFPTPRRPVGAPGNCGRSAWPRSPYATAASRPCW
jgi:hypothetical protein